MMTLKNDGPHKSEEKLQAPIFRKHLFISQSVLSMSITKHNIVNYEIILDTTMSVHYQVCIVFIHYICTQTGQSAISLEFIIYIGIYLSFKSACLVIYKTLIIIYVILKKISVNNIISI